MLTLTKNSLNFNGTYMGWKQPFESFFEEWMLWVISFMGVNAFVLGRILFALDFCYYILSSGYHNRKI